MSTNKSTIKALKKISEEIHKLATFNKILKQHIQAQSKQGGQYAKDDYKIKEKKVIRTRNGKTVSSY
jgi:predicted phage-related endonuclease